MIFQVKLLNTKKLNAIARMISATGDTKIMIQICCYECCVKCFQVHKTFGIIVYIRFINIYIIFVVS